MRATCGISLRHSHEGESGGCREPQEILSPVVIPSPISVQKLLVFTWLRYGCVAKFLSALDLAADSSQQRSYGKQFTVRVRSSQITVPPATSPRSADLTPRFQWIRTLVQSCSQISRSVPLPYLCKEVPYFHMVTAWVCRQIPLIIGLSRRFLSAKELRATNSSQLASFQSQLDFRDPRTGTSIVRRVGINNLQGRDPESGRFQSLLRGGQRCRPSLRGGRRRWSG